MYARQQQQLVAPSRELNLLLRDYVKRVLPKVVGHETVKAAVHLEPVVNANCSRAVSSPRHTAFGECSEAVRHGGGGVSDFTNLIR